ncbi:MAG TPA: NADH-quinone oxidoreductase subunit M [bacterium]|nr:NADH-quinone oxidoreductase subunit M [bacterium]
MFQIIAAILIPFAASFLFFHNPATGGANLLPPLTSFIVIPALGALAVMALSEKAARWATLLMASLELGLAARVFFIYQEIFHQNAAAGFQLVEEVPWLKNFGINYILAVDGMSTLMVLLVACVYFAGSLISWSISLRIKEYFVLFNLLVCGVAGAYESVDLFFFFLFYEFAVLPMYLLVGIWGSGRKEYAAMKLTLMLLAGSAFMLVGFIAMYYTSQVHTFDLRVLGDLSKTGFSAGFQRAWFPLLFLGFGVISAIFPFHTWSPDGYGSAPTAASMLHAGVLKSLGGYSIIRVALPAMPDGAKYWLPLLVFMSLINILYAAIVALKQKDFKYVIAYSSVSHCGAILFGICTLQTSGLNGAIIQTLSHGIVAAMTFALVGTVYGKAHTRELAKLGGLAACMPVLGGLFTAAAMANVGLPGLSGFVGEFLIFMGAYRSGYHGGFSIFQYLFPIAILAIVMTAVYYLRLVQMVFFGPLKDPHFKDEVKDGTFVEILPIAFLLCVSLLVGLYPKPFVDMSNAAIAPLVEHIGGFK